MISPVNAIGAIPDDVPVLILAGTADRMARPEEARALHAKVASHSQLVWVPNAGHGDLLMPPRNSIPGWLSTSSGRSPQRKADR